MMCTKLLGPVESILCFPPLHHPLILIPVPVRERRARALPRRQPPASVARIFIDFLRLRPLCLLRGFLPSLELSNIVSRFKRHYET